MERLTATKTLGLQKSFLSRLQMNSEREKLSIIVIVFIVLLTSWGFPGNPIQVGDWAMICSMMLLLVPVFSNWRTPRETLRTTIPVLFSSFSHKSLSVRTYSISIAILTIVLVISTLNPSHETSYLPTLDEVLLSQKTHINWLPRTAIVPETNKQIFSLISLVAVTGPMTYYLVGSRKTIRVILWIVVTNSIILSITGMFFKFTGNPKILGMFVPADARYFFSTFTYKNHWGAYCLITIGIIGALTQHYQKVHAKRRTSINSPLPILILASFIIGLTVALSGSRSCAVTYGLMLFVYLNKVILYQIPTSSNRFCKRVVSTLIATTVGLTISLASLNSHGATRDEMISNTIRQIENIKIGKLENRVYITRDTWKMFKDKPIWGWGLGSFRFIINDPGRYLGNEHEYAYVYAHNDWIQYMAELGILGFILLGLILIIPLFICKRTGIPNPITNWICFTVFIIYAYSLVEFPCRTPAVSFLLTVVVALSTKYSLLERRKETTIDRQD